ncbi:NADPH-dependent diflavin oxidoreductase 1 [Terramyces sp. JEL0728]|nr:NADPH-dependent diflavin oxidoreductase 1 [Terramyces sp. JEL0728]
MPHKILILYASEMGYAQETAERIAREARQRHYIVSLVSMHEYDLQNLPNEQLVCFVCSVTGQGEEPKTMKSFWRFLLKKSLPTDSLTSMKFGVFGQGDSSYVNVDGALDPWLELFWESALKLFPMPAGLDVIPSTTLPHSTFEIEFIKDPEILHSDSLKAVVLKNERITTETHFQDVRHFEFKVPKDTEYNAGDIMVIKTRNRREKVLEVLEHFGWTNIMNDYIKFKVNPLVPDAILPAWLHSPTTLLSLFENHLDIFGRPRRYFFHLLSFFVSDELQKEKLIEFASTEGQSDLYTYAHKMRRTIFEVLKDFSSVKIPLKYLPDLIPKIRERHFSISSPPTLGKINLAVAVVEYQTKLVEKRVGVCTNWMKSLVAGGPGTGVAPMRSLLLHYCKNYPSSADLLTIAKNCLIFGNRNKEHDYLYEQDWKILESNGQLAILTAFSRDQEDKIYVQHRMRENASLLWNMIDNQNASVYLSGNAKRMPIDVEEALLFIFETEGKMNPAEAQGYFKSLEKNKRFQQECWSYGGGGERVLWTAIDGIQQRYPQKEVVIYTWANAEVDLLLDKVEKQFGFVLDADRILFLKLHTWPFLESKRYKRLTLITSSLGSIVTGWEAFTILRPKVLIESVGFAFIYPIAKIFGCKLVSYVHYPTISSDMIEKVKNRDEAFNNSSSISKSSTLSILKLWYYRLFSKVYGLVGSFCDVIMVNSTWTKNHINKIWKPKVQAITVYPPCDTLSLLKFELNPESRQRIILSVAQFRPEKDHELQIKSFHELLKRYPKYAKGNKAVKLVLIGGVRNEGDQERVDKLKKMIAVLYLAAAGLITLGHNSGGPLMDIVTPGNGYLASDLESYVGCLKEILELSADERVNIQSSARKHVQSKFSESSFKDDFIDAIKSLISGASTDESEGEYRSEDDDYSDDEWREVKSWDKDLMGDSKDRKRLMAMSEFEREKELAERREKLDQLNERTILKNRVKSQQKVMESAKLTDRQRKGQTLENLRKSREKREKERSSRFSEKSEKRIRMDSDESDESEDDYDDLPKKNKHPPITYEDALSIQIKRDELEQWLHKPMFEKSAKGCFLRLSLGNSGIGKELIYRVVLIEDIKEYKRKYKLNLTFTKVALDVSHGKSKKETLMDMISNQPITAKEWNRYEVQAKIDKVSLTKNHITRKLADLKAIREHVFSDAEITAMIEKKKAMKQVVGNASQERLRLKLELEAAQCADDTRLVLELSQRIEELQSIVEMNKTTSTQMENLAKINAKYQSADIREGREAEIAALQLKRQKGVSLLISGNNEDDPFARRKTQPLHIVQSESVDPVKPTPNSSPSKKAKKIKAVEKVEDSDDEDPFDNLDISILEKDLEMNF